MKRFSCLFVLSIFLWPMPGAAKDKWIKIESKHFTLAGNASERNIRTVATRLEQFRSVFSQMFPCVRVDSAVPITVLVFRNRSSFYPFMPVRNGKTSEVSGYIVPGQDVTYITLSSDIGETDPYATIFHEFVHSLTNNSRSKLPVWLNEGLAEFYSTFKVAGQDTQLELGAPISHHIYRLREGRLMPLARLFAVSQESPEYNQNDENGMFFSQSWALVHYLLLANNARRQPQFSRFVELLVDNVPFGEAFPKAFQTDFAAIEKELDDYLRRSAYPVGRYTPRTRLTFDDEMTASEIDEAEVDFFLGDLLAHQGRADAEEYLQASIRLDPTFAPAFASLGLLKTSAGDFDAARRYLEKAVAHDKLGRNHLVYYYYAQALLRQGSTVKSVKTFGGDFDRQNAAMINANLQRAISIRPAFVPAYSLLAFISLVTGEKLDETAAQLKSVLDSVPSEQNLALQLGQILLRLQRIEDARKLVAPIARSSPNPSLQKAARSQLDAIEEYEQLMAGSKAGRGANIPMQEAFPQAISAPDRLEVNSPQQETGEYVACETYSPPRSVRIFYRKIAALPRNTMER